jgi:hypothetical protein
MTEASIQEQRGDLLHRAQREHERLVAIVDALPAERLTTPGVTDEWSVKDHLAHLTWWEQRVIRVLGGARDPIDLIPIEEKDADTVNASVFAQNKGHSLEDVRAAFDASYQEMLRLIQTVPDEVFVEQQDWISGNSDYHYAEHAQMLEAWLAREGGSTAP